MILGDIESVYESCSRMMRKMIAWEETDVEKVEEMFHHKLFRQIH
jgi:hypothetical protein